jgi:predicted nucleic acid-binding protein
VERGTAHLVQSRVEQPIYALDVNVFLDVIKDRPRGEYARRLLTASLSGMLRLFVAREFVNELARAAKDQSVDPVVQLAMTLPQFIPVPDPFLSNLQEELGRIIFPTRQNAGQLRTRDKSDLIHLATMIYHAASGFVTSDDSILSKQAELRAKYSIEVIGPVELAEIYLPLQWKPTQLTAQSTEGASIKVHELTESQRSEVESFLLSCSVEKTQVTSATSPGQSACPRHRVVVSVGEEIIGYAAWEAARGTHSSSEAWLTVDPISPMAELACDVLLDAMFRDVSKIRPARLTLDGQRTSRESLEYAKEHGFTSPRKQNHPTILEKFCIGRIITRLNWEALGLQMANSFGFALPAAPAVYTGFDTNIIIDENKSTAEAVPLREFETRFGPIIMMLPGRPVIVVPIQRAWADMLLSTARQHLLFPPPEASVLGEKLYLSSPRTLSVITAGAIIFFYESIGADNGRGAIIAAAQVTRTAIQETAKLDSGTTRRGVLTSDEVNSVSAYDKTGLTFFNQLMWLENPITLSRLRELGCADGANFVTARQIDENAALSIIEEGKPNVRLS